VSGRAIPKIVRISSNLYACAVDIVGSVRAIRIASRRPVPLERPRRAFRLLK
jgi:hypothetical protein